MSQGIRNITVIAVCSLPSRFMEVMSMVPRKAPPVPVISEIRSVDDMFVDKFNGHPVQNGHMPLSQVQTFVSTSFLHTFHTLKLADSWIIGNNLNITRNNCYKNNCLTNKNKIYICCFLC